MLHASRLSTTPTRSLISHAIFKQVGPLRRVDFLAGFGIKELSVFLKNTTMHSLPSSKPRDGCQLVLLFTERYRR